MYLYDETFLCQNFVAVTMSIINNWKEEWLTLTHGREDVMGRGSSCRTAGKPGEQILHSLLFPFLPTFIPPGLPACGMAEPELRVCPPPFVSPF